MSILIFSLLAICSTVAVRVLAPRLVEADSRAYRMGEVRPSRRVMVLVSVFALAASVVPFQTSSAVAGTIPETSTLTVIEPGAYIIDLGVSPQTINNGLKPYGLVYELMIAQRIPVVWAINDGKVKDGVDFSYDGKDYSGGPFIITSEYAAQAAPIIAQWVANYPGLTVDGPTATAFQAPVFDTLTNWPNAVLDDQNGSIAEGYFENASVPETILRPDGTTKIAYEFKEPAALNPCDDLYVMPHADPEWETHSNLVTFNELGGFIWAACHAVSVLENVTDPSDPDPDPDMNFLSTEGLVDFGDHGDGTPPYEYATSLGGDPVMQFLGSADEGMQNGSEQIFLPAPNSAWRPSSRILAWDPDQEDLITEGGVSPGEAGAILYGRGFGDPTNGFVMYEAGHSHDGGDPDEVAAQRAFLNLNLMTGIERGIDIVVDAPEVMVSGSLLPVSATVSGGHPAYEYEWLSSCGGSFFEPTGTMGGPGTVNTTFTPPDSAQDCTVRLVVDDTCGRFSFAADGVRIVEQSDLSITKTDGVDGAEDGSLLSYSLAIANAGPTDATNVVVTDTVPIDVTFLSATPTQGSCNFDGVDVTCDLGELAIDAAAAVDVVVQINEGVTGTITNTAVVTADQEDPNPDDNTDTDDTAVGINGLELAKTATPVFIDQDDLAAGGGSVDVTFDLVVTNAGPDTLTDVSVTDDTCGAVVPTEGSPGVNIGDIANTGALDPGEAWQFSCTTPVSNDTDNIATVTATHPVIGEVSATDTAHVEVIAPDFTIAKGPDGAQHSADGEVVFEITVTNSGDVDLAGVVVSDPHAPNCDRVLGTLAAGQAVSYYCAIDPTPPAGTSDTNSITAEATTAGGDTLTRDDTAPYSVVDRDLGITKDPIDCSTGAALVDPEYYVGDSACYRIVVENTGSQSQQSVTVDDILPGGLIWNSTTVTAPVDIMAEDWSDDPAEKGWLNGWVEVDNEDRTGGDVRHEEAPDLDLAVGLNKMDTGLLQHLDFSAADTVTVSFEWVDDNDDLDKPGGVSLATYEEGTATWSRLASFAVAPPSPPDVFGPETATLLIADVPALFAGPVSFGFVGDVDEKVYIDDVQITWSFGGTVLGTVVESFDWTFSDAYSQGWLEINDNDEDDNGNVRVTDGTHNTDCLDTADCVLQIDDKDRGIYLPIDLSSRDMCSITFDWATLDSKGGEPGILNIVAWNGSSYVNLGSALALDDSDVAALPSWHTGVTIPFDEATYPGVFNSGGRVGFLSGIDNAGEDEVLIDNISISCEGEFVGHAAPGLVTSGDGIDLAVGRQMSIVVSTTVGGSSPFPRELSNVARTSSNQQPQPSEAVATIERVVPLINLDKVADTPLVSPGDSAAFSFAVTNIGNDPLENVAVTDSGIPGCVPAYQSGDDGDGILALDETWQYTCTAPVPSDAPIFVNTATVQGDPTTPGTGADIPVTGSDSATVEIVNSAIDITKSVDRSMIRPNEPVTYTYDVALDAAAGSAEPLTGVFVEDDQCAPVAGPTAGDDGNGILEAGETWIFSCSTTLATTTTNIATAYGTDRASVEVTDSDSLTVTVVDAVISLTKTVTPTTIAEGDTVTYTIAATNGGNDTFQNVVVTDDTCSPLVGPSGDNGNGLLDPAETWTYTCAATPPDDTTNIASVSGRDSLGKTWTDADDAFVNVLEPSLSVAKLPDTSLILGGDTVVYTFLVYNDGDSEFTTVTVTDPLCEPITGPTGDDGDGALSPAEGWTYACTTTLGATTVNTVTVNADGPGGPASTEDSATVRVRDPLLTLVKTAGASSVAPGTLVTYTFDVSNTSVCLAGDVVCEQDNEMSQIAVSDDHCSTAPTYVSGDSGTIGVLEVGETWSLACTEPVNAPTTNTATASAEDVLGVLVTSNSDQAFVDVTVDPELSIVKTGPASGRVGQTVTYDFAVSNSTDCSTHLDPSWCASSSWIDGIAITDDVAGSAGPVLVGIYNVGDVDEDWVLDVGETWSYTVDYILTASDLASRDPLVNTGLASGTDKDGDTVTADDTHSLDVTPLEADLSLLKSVSNATPTRGNQVTFTLTVANDGPDAATNVEVTDLLPSGLTYVSDTTTQGSHDGGSGVWTVGTLSSGGSASMTVTVAVDTDAATTNVAEVTATDQFDPDSTPDNGVLTEDDQASADVTPIPLVDLSLVKSVGNATPDRGADVVFTIDVANAGPSDATGILVTDLLPAGLTYVSSSASLGSYAAGTGVWDIGSIAALDSETLTITATVNTDLAITNVAQVTAANQGDVDSTPNNSIAAEDDYDDAGITPRLIADLSLSKTETNSPTYVGDTAVFEVTVANAGPSGATGVEVSDLLPAGLTYVSHTGSQGAYVSGSGLWTVGSIPAGGSAILTIAATVTAAGTIANWAEVASSDQYDPNSTPNNHEPLEDDQDSASVATVIEADVSLTKTVDDATPFRGGQVTFTITAANAGPNAATGVTVTDVLPTGLTSDSDSASQGAYDDASGVWTIGTLASGQSETLTVTATVDTDAAVTNTAELTTANENDPDSTPGNGEAAEDDQASVDVTPVPVADLALVKLADNATPNRGSTVTFTIQLTNNGPSTATDVEVTDQIPSGLSYVSSTASLGSYDDGSGVWTVGDLAAMGAATLTITATVNTDAAVANTAQVTAVNEEDPDSEPDNDEATEDDQDSASLTPVPIVDLSLSKTANTATPLRGGSVVFTIEVANDGPSDATGVAVTDLLPTGLDYTSASASQGSYDNASGVWTVGALGTGQTENLTITAAVNTDAVTTNSTQVTAANEEDSDSTPNNNIASEDDQDSYEITPTPVVDVSLVKSVDNMTPDRGAQVVFTIEVANDGPSNASGIQVTDLLPAGLAYVSSSASQGSYNNVSGLWTVGALTVGQSESLAITATVNTDTAVSNSAEVTAANELDSNSTPANGIASENDQDAAAIVPRPVADLSLVKTETNAPTHVGDDAVFEVVVTNDGPSDASGVVVEDLLPAGLTYASSTVSQGSYVAGTGAWTVGGLASGTSATLTVTATVDTDSPVTNTAEITAADQHDSDSTPNNHVASEDDQDSATVSAAIEADLSLAKTVDNTTPNRGSSVVFTIVVTNDGPNAATGVAVTDALPVGLTYVSDSPTQGTYDDSTGLWTVGGLASGATASLTITATVDTDSPVTNTAEVTAANENDSDSTPNNQVPGEDDQDSVDLNPVPVVDVSLTKSVSNATPNRGTDVVFTIEVDNAGPSDASGVAATDVLPAGLTYVSHATAQGSYVSATGLWTIYDLASGASATLTVTATVDTDLAVSNSAEVTAANEQDADSTPGNGIASEDDQASADVTPVPVVDVSLTKRVDDSAPHRGDTVTFTINVDNTGPSDATGVAVTDVLPAGVTYLSNSASQGSYDSGSGVWTVGTLPVSAVESLSITARVDTDSPVTNSAQVTAANEQDSDSTPGNDVPSEDDQASADVTPVPLVDVSLTKTVDDATPDRGDQVTFTIDLANDGPSNASGVVVTDLLPADLLYVSHTTTQGLYVPATGAWSVGAVAAFGSARLTVTATVDTDAAAVNSAEVTATNEEDSDSEPNNHDPLEDDQASAVVSSDPLVDLSLAKSVDDASPNRGDQVTFTIVVANAGPSNATGVVVADVLPAGLTYVSQTTSQGAYDDASGVWAVGGVAAPGSATLTITASVDTDAGVSNSVEVTAANQPDIDSTPGNDNPSEDDQASVDVSPVPLVDVSLAKSVDDATPVRGTDVVFTIVVDNAGPSDASGVVVTDVLPAGLTYVSSAPAGVYDHASGVWTVGAIASGASASLMVTATVDTDAVVTNSAQVTATNEADDDSAPNNNDPSEDDQDSAALTPVPLVDVSLTKRVDDSAPNRGDTVTFTLNVDNTGPSDASGVAVTDVLPAGLTYLSNSASQGSYDSGSGVWTVGALPVSAVESLTITARVDTDSPVTNTGEVFAVNEEDSDSEPDNQDPGEDDQASVDVNPVPVVDLSLTKTVSDATPDRGDTITFSIEVVNAGPSDASGVAVTDVLPAGISYVSSAPVGAYDDATGVWTVGSIAALGSETLTITATVDTDLAVSNSAEVTAATEADSDSTPANGVASEDDQDTAGLTPRPLADLSLTKVETSAPVYVGDTAVFEITVSNAGPSAATGVVVEDLLPAGLSYAASAASQGTYASSTGVWTVGSMAALDSETLTITAFVRTDASVSNVAEVSASDQHDPNSTPDNNAPTEDDQDSASVDVDPLADLSLTKAIDDATPAFGDTVTFTITVANDGPSSATGVTVTDQLPAGLTYVSSAPAGAYDDATGVWTVGTIASGASATLTVTATVTGAAADANGAEVTAVNEDDPDSTPDNDTSGEDDQDSASYDPIAIDLSLSKSVSSATPDRGSDITFEIVVTNAGPDAATDVEVTDLLPTGLGYVSDTATQGSYDDSTGVWAVGAVASSGSATLSVTATVNTDLALVNTAEVSAAIETDVDSIPGNGVGSEDDQDAAAVTPVAVADLSLTKTETNSPVYVGDIATFEIVVANAGPSSATGVEVADVLPAGLTYVSSAPIDAYDNASGVWTVGTVASGAASTLTVTATVETDAPVSNSAEVTSSNEKDPNSTPDNGVAGEDDQDSALVDVDPLVDLSLVKLVDDATPDFGSQVAFTIQVTNSGPSDASGVEVTDLLPAGLTYVSSAPVGDYDAATGVWTVGSIAAIDSATLTVLATVDTDSPVSNSAQVTAANEQDSDSTPGNDVPAEDDQDTVLVTPIAVDVSLTKSVDDATPDRGDDVTFTIVVANAGPSDATGVEVTDVLSAGLTFVSSAPVGVYDDGSGVWTVGTIASGASATLTVTATVNTDAAFTNVAEVTNANEPDVDSTPGNDDPSEDDQASADVAPVPVADVSLTKTVDEATPNRGASVVFTIVVTNDGPSTATGVAVTDALPAGLTYVSDAPSQGTYNNSSGVWTVGPLTSGRSASLIIVATVDTDSPVTNTAEVLAANEQDSDSTPGNNVPSEDDQASAGVTPVPVVDLSLTKSVDEASPVRGTDVVFTIVVDNAGPSDASGVAVADVLPAGLTYSSDVPSQGSYVAASGVWTIGSVASGASATLTITATVDTDLAVSNSAEVTAANEQDADSTPGNGIASEDDQDAVGVTPVPLVDVSLTKRVDSAAPYRGDTVTFTLNVDNTGPSDATGVAVTDVLPAGLTYLSNSASQGSYDSGSGVWTVGTLPVSAVESLTITARVDTDSAMTNTAQVTAMNEGDSDSTPGNDVPSEDDQASADVTPVPLVDVSLTKTVDDSTPDRGDDVTFTIVVSNDGPSDATGVEVTDVLSAGLTFVSSAPVGVYDDGSGVWTVGTIAVGASATLTVTATVDVDAPVTNSAEVTAVNEEDSDSTPDNDDPSEDDQASAGVTPVPIADLSLTKTVDDATPDRGDTITFTIVVSNDGPSDATGVVVTDALPSGLTYVSDTTTEGSYVSATSVWTIGGLASGASETLTVTATVDTDSPVTNSAEVTAANEQDPDSTPDNDVPSEDDQASTGVTPVPVADLSLTKTVDEAAPDRGDTITFTIDAANAGPSAATGVEVTDVLPAGLTYVSSAPVGVYDDATGLWTVGTIASGASATLTITATVDTDLALTNVAQVTAANENDSDSTPDNDDPSEDDQASAGVTPVPVVDLELVKLVDEATPNRGSDVTFTIQAANNGPSDATGVEVVDVLPTGLTYVSDTATAGSYDDTSGIWTVGTITALDTETLTITATVDVDAPVTNSAEVTAVNEEDSDSTPGNDVPSEDDQASAGITPVPVADISLTKTVDDATPDRGDTITFTLTASNAGPSAATGVEVTDVLPAGLTFVSSAPAGAYDDGSGVWTVGTVASGASAMLTITAMVDTDLAVSNSAEVTATNEQDPDSTPDNDVPSEDDQASAGVTPVPLVDVSLTKTVDDATPDRGDDVTFTIEVDNAGPSAATGVEVTDVLPTGLTYVSSAPVGAYDDASGVWMVGTVASGASATLTITATVDVDAPVTNSAEVTAVNEEDSDSTPGNDDPSEDDQASAGITPVPVADISLTKTVDEATPDRGDTITFTLTASNAGPSAATGVEVTDVLPTGLTYVSSAPVGAYDDGSGVWTVGTVASGASAMLTITATVDTDLAVSNSAEVTAANEQDPDSTPDNDVPSEDDQASAGVTPVRLVDVSLTKTVDDAMPDRGDDVTFTIEVDNAGPSAATGVEVTDVLPSGLTYVSDTTTQGAYDDATGIWTVGTVAATDTQTLTITAAVDGGAPMLNSAEVTAANGQDSDSTPNNGVASEDDQDSAAVTPVAIGLAKAVGTVTNHGDGTFTVSYLLTLENLGAATISDLEVYDDVATQFGGLSPTDLQASDGTLTSNPLWDGSATSTVLAAGQSLASGETGTVQISFVATPGSDMGPHLNSASVIGTTPDDGSVTDDSTDGIDPDSDGDDTDGTTDNDGIPDEDTPTPVSFDEEPAIGVAKRMVFDPVSNGDGSFDLTYELTVENFGDVALSGLQVSEDLAATFTEADSWELVSVDSTTFTVSPTYDGGVDINLLTGVDGLGLGESGTIDLIVRVTPGVDAGPYWNSVMATADTPSGASVGDVSQDGVDSDPDGNGDPTDNTDPTPVEFPGGDVEGVIWDDVDGSSAMDPAESGIEGVTVTLVDPGTDGLVGTADDRIVGTAVTAADGSYAFTDVPAGEYVSVIDPTTLPPAFQQSFDPDGVLDGMTAVTVSAGVTTSGVDFGYVGAFNLVLTKTAPAERQKGENLDFTITVTNEGPAVAQGPITVRDVVPSTLPVSGANATGASCTVTGQTVECDVLGDMAVGDTAQIIVHTTVNASAGTTVTNTATVEAIGPIPEIDITDNTDSATVSVGELPHTGFDLFRFATIGTLLLLAGLVLIAATRRREDEEAQA